MKVYFSKGMCKCSKKVQEDVRNSVYCTQLELAESLLRLLSSLSKPSA